VRAESISVELRFTLSVGTGVGLAVANTDGHLQPIAALSEDVGFEYDPVLDADPRGMPSAVFHADSSANALCFELGV